MFKSKENTIFNKPYKKAYTDMVRIKFKDGKSQKIPIVTNDGFCLAAGNKIEFFQTILKMDTDTIVISHGDVATVDNKHPSLTMSEEDVDKERYHFIKGIFKEVKKDKAPLELDEEEVPYWKIYKLCEEYMEGLEMMCKSTKMTLNTLFDGYNMDSYNWMKYRTPRSLIENPEIGEDCFDLFVHSINIKPVLETNGIEENFDNIKFKLLEAENPDLYTIHFEIESRYILKNEDGSLKVVVEGEEKPGLVNFANNIMNDMKFLWAPTYINIFRVNNEVPVEKLDEMKKRVKFANVMRQVANLIEDACRIRKHEDTYLKSATAKEVIRLIAEELQNPTFSKNISKYINLDYHNGIGSECPFLTSLINEFVMDDKGKMTTSNIILMLRSPRYQWLIYHIGYEIKEGISNQSDSNNFFIDLFLFVTKFLKYTIPGENIQSIISNVIIKIMDKLLSYCPVSTNRNESETVIKEYWEKFPYRLEIIYLSKFFFDTIFKPAINIIDNQYETLTSIMKNNLGAIIPKGVVSNEKTKEWINFLEEFAKQINQR